MQTNKQVLGLTELSNSIVECIRKLNKIEPPEHKEYGWAYQMEDKGVHDTSKAFAEGQNEFFRDPNCYDFFPKNIAMVRMSVDGVFGKRYSELFSRQQTVIHKALKWGGFNDYVEVIGFLDAIIENVEEGTPLNFDYSFKKFPVEDLGIYQPVGEAIYEQISRWGEDLEKPLPALKKPEVIKVAKPQEKKDKEKKNSDVFVIFAVIAVACAIFFT